MRLVKHVIALFVFVVMSGCGGPAKPTPVNPPPAPAPSSPALAFTTPNLGGVYAGQANSGYSFCRPAISGNDLCGSSSTNPSGGTPPYTFELGTGGGFPPIGMHLNLNGTLTGTPSVQGTSNFIVCAVDLVNSSKCDTVRFIVDPPPATPALLPAIVLSTVLERPMPSAAQPAMTLRSAVGLASCPSTPMRTLLLY